MTIGRAVPIEWWGRNHSTIIEEEEMGYNKIFCSFIMNRGKCGPQMAFPGLRGFLVVQEN